MVIILFCRGQSSVENVLQKKEDFSHATDSANSSNVDLLFTQSSCVTSKIYSEENLITSERVYEMHVEETEEIYESSRSYNNAISDTEDTHDNISECMKSKNSEALRQSNNEGNSKKR